MSGSISIHESPGELVLTGDHEGIRLIITGLRHDISDDQVNESWNAACKIAEILEYGEAMLIDIPSARTTHVRIREMGQEPQ